MADFRESPNFNHHIRAKPRACCHTNFTLDLDEPTLLETMKVLIKLNRLTMKPDESVLAIHYTMTYKVQIHMFFMNHTILPITKFTAGEGRII